MAAELTEAQRRAYRDAVDAVNRATDREIAEVERQRPNLWRLSAYADPGQTVTTAHTGRAALKEE